ncbi:MAG: hypothetical protein KAI24_24420 [Planctomycetes bacterium]|nr:hypothetical protein [Planctomycetota bacterium]
MNPTANLVGIPCLIAAISLSSTATAQTNWSLLGVTSHPSPRADHALSYMPPSPSYPEGVMVMYGGRTLSAPYQVLSDTWIFDIANETWSSLGNSSVVGPRVAHAMAYDPAIGAVVLFGGATGLVSPTTTPSYQTAQDTTFIFNGLGWSQLPIAASPIKRFDHSMCYDPVLGRVVKTAGFDDQNRTFFQWHVVEQTMSLYHDFSTNPPSHFWTSMPSSGAVPAMGGGCSITYDEVGQQIVLAGRNHNTSVNQIWTLPTNPPNSPWTLVNYSGPNMLGSVWQAQYDVARDRTVIFSSTGPANGYEYYANTLEQTGAGQSPVGVDAGPVTVYDPINRRCLFYNGQIGNSTWSYRPTTLSNVARRNTPGCLNSNSQMATLDKAAGTEWQSEQSGGVDTTRNMRMSNLIPNQPVQLMASFGLSSPNPAVTFANGCQQWIDNPTSSFPIRYADATGTSFEPVTFPPGYAGITVYYQFVAADPNVPVGFVLSNVLEVTAGSTL